MEASLHLPRHGVERYHFALRRLHSLTGIVPIGAFLVEHLLTNFGVVVGGEEKYNHDVGLIQGLPWLAVIEWVFIFLPLAFHAGYGAFITVTGKSNLLHYPYGGNIRYVLQRITAILTAIFLVVHLLKFRFYYLVQLVKQWLGAAPEALRYFAEGNAYVQTARGLHDPLMIPFYAVGIVAAAYHLANGVWTALITWGITLGKRSQLRAGYVCAVIGAVLGAMGLASLMWFHRAGRLLMPQ